MEISIKPNFLLLVVVVFLGGCSHTARTPTPTVEIAFTMPIPRIPGASPSNTPILEATSTSTLSPQPSSTPTLSRKSARQTRQAPTITPTQTQRATSTPDLPPENILKYRPFEISTSLPADVKPSGALLVVGDQPQLLHFDPAVRLEKLSDIDPTCLSASPDGQWMAYCLLSDDSPTGRWLKVDSADRQRHFQVAMDLYLISFDYYEWLDNQHLIFPLIQGTGRFYPMVAINPFTGEETELASDYPGIVGTYIGSAGTMAFEYSDVVYDPSLNRVVFPEQRDSKEYIALWDQLSKAVLAEVEDKGKFLHYPLWSPNAKQFVVAARQPSKRGNNVEEWYSVSREGQVEQLTHFGDYFNAVTIGANANWSPDGQKLAFWLNAKPSSCLGVRLAVLEIASGQVTDTCIPGTFGFSKPPIWSLDSRYIALRNVGDNSENMILVDFEQGRAFDITEYGAPVGWLAVP